MSTIRINLLPHRQIKRAQQQRILILLAAVVAAAAGLVVFAGHMVLEDAQNHQKQRNELLHSEIRKLDGQIKEIQQLKDKTQALLDRKIVVETLQTNRTEAVHLFDDLARQVPEGLFLKSFKQAGNTLTLQGFAQSSARVSTFMRNLEDSPWFESPNLVEVRSAMVGKLKASEFTLTVKQSKPKTDKAEG